MRRFCIALVPCMLLTACATTTQTTDRGPQVATPSGGTPPAAAPSKPAPAAAPTPPSGTPPSATAVNLTPYTTLAHRYERKPQIASVLSNMYTRLILRSRLAANGDGTPAAAYPYSPRTAFDRFFLGKSYAVTVTAKVKVGDFEATTPLVTVDHQSNSQVGEKWGRVIQHVAHDFPWFLVKGNGENTVGTLTVSLKGTNEYDSHAVANAVSAVVKVAQAVAPQASVVTNLSKQAAKDKADALDAAFGKLFGSSLSEDNSADYDMRYWAPDNEMSLVVRMPKSESRWGTDDMYEVGTWLIGFDDPRPSIFSDLRLSCGKLDSVANQTACDAEKRRLIAAVYRDVAPSSVLSFTLVRSDANKTGTLRAYLAQQEWYATGISAVAAGTAGSAATFCRNVLNTVSELGLNNVDADIVLWAVAGGMPMSGATAAGIRSDADCKPTFDRIGR